MSLLPEADELRALLEQAPDSLIRTETLIEIKVQDTLLPIIGLALGSLDPQAPVLAIVGGIHGLERIGSEVVIAYLRSLTERLGWSKSIREQFSEIRVVMIPIANPAGMAEGTRCNANGVDLMRNAPVDSPHALRFFGGQRVSRHLPYFRGKPGAELEPELRAIESFLVRETFQSRASIVLDVHSGFGVRDRIWFPFAREPAPFPLLPEAAGLIHNFERAFSNHPYTIEPQSRSYCTHGDFWDYLFDLYYKTNAGAGRVFLPLTLEMGSWGWVRKNPRQLFSFLGAFNPVKPHRRRRALRRHLPLLDFLRDSVQSHGSWCALSDASRQILQEQALVRWFGAPGR